VSVQVAEEWADPAMARWRPRWPGPEAAAAQAQRHRRTCCAETAAGDGETFEALTSRLAEVGDDPEPGAFMSRPAISGQAGAAS